MRVALVSEHASPLTPLGGVDAGGQNVHVAALATSLQRTGADVTVYTRRHNPDLPRRVRTPHFDVVHVDAGPARVIPKDDIYEHVHEFAGRLASEWRRTPPDVVHAHFWMSGLAAMEAAAHVGVPVVQTFHALGTVKRRHQGAADTSPDQRCGEERRLVRSVDHMVATCSDEVLELTAMGAQEDRITVIPCGVDTAVFHPHGTRLARGERRRIVAVSRLVPRKGLADLVRAVAEIPDAELLIAGGPPCADLGGCAEAVALRDVARSLGIAHRVRLLGALNRDDVPSLLRSADVVAGVPWYEPFGIVPVEAMACGVPFVGSAVGGLLDTVVDGVTGRLVPPRDPYAVAGAIRQLLDDGELRAAMGRAGAVRARQYEWDAIAERTRACYEDVVERRMHTQDVGT